MHIIYDQAQRELLNIRHCSGVVHHRKIRYVVIQGIDRKITSPDIVFDIAVFIIMQDTAGIGW